MFTSILFKTNSRDCSYDCTISEESLRDLHITDILKPITEHTVSKETASAFLRPLQDISLIYYRQNIMADFDHDECLSPIKLFSETILQLKQSLDVLLNKGHLPDDLMDCSHYLHLADSYCSTVMKLSHTDRTCFSSEGMKLFFKELDIYINSSVFQNLIKDIHSLYDRLSDIHFCMLIKEGRIKIRPYENQRRLDGDVKTLFSKFSQNTISSVKADIPQLHNLHGIDCAVLDLLCRWYKEEFRELRKFASDLTKFPDTGLLKFAEESFFYLNWQELIRPLKTSQLPFCYPKIAGQKGSIYCNDGFDLSLAVRLFSENIPVVTNSFYLENEERTLVVTGPNQGGKTTFARFFGQVFYFSSLGLSIPGTSAALITFDHIWTHFNQKENLDNLSGKLQDDIFRLKKIF